MDAVTIFCAKYLFLLAFLVLAYFFYFFPTEARRKLARLSIFTLPLSYILGVVVRSLWYNPRPFVIKNMDPLIAHIPDNGFPSDHTLLLATLASITYHFDKRCSAVLWLITILVGFSRMLAQVHHFVDILGSILIALVSTLLVHFVLERAKKV